MRTRVAVIDNYDSFTYNLVQYLAEMGAEPRVFRNDEVSSSEDEVPRPPLVTKFLVYRKERVRAVYVPDALFGSAPPHSAYSSP